MNKFKIGDIVRVINRSFISPDKDGVVITVDDDGWCGVYFQGWFKGHDLHEMIDTKSGYYLPPDHLELVEDVFVENE